MSIPPTGHVPFGADAARRRELARPLNLAPPAVPALNLSPPAIPYGARRVICETPMLQRPPSPLRDRVVFIERVVERPFQRPPSPPLLDRTPPPLTHRVVSVQTPPVQFPPPRHNPMSKGGNVAFGSGR